MSVNLQQYRGAAGAFNICFNHNNINKNVFHIKPNALSIASAYFAIPIIFFTFLSILKNFFFIILFRKNIKTINLMTAKVVFIVTQSNVLNLHDSTFSGVLLFGNSFFNSTNGGLF